MDDYDELLEAVNASFLLLMGILIFLMQAGFAFLEAGSVRAKNTTNIIIKNVIDASIGALGFWITGYAFGYGSESNAFIGTKQFFLINTPESDYPSYFVAYVFALASSTIVSGSLAERAQLQAYIFFTAFMSMFIYPIVTHWVWNDAGWLNDLDYHDFAGSSVVHVVGGTSALVGATMLGPRIGRFQDGIVQAIPGHSVVLLALGFFLLWFGFFAFNASSEGGIVGNDIDTEIPGRAAVNTALASSSGIISTLIIGKIGFSRHEIILFGREMKLVTIFSGFWSVTGAVNGGLAAMVAICAGCDVFEPWAAMVVGLIAGFVYTFFSRVLLMCRIDDPVNAVAIHLFGGIWGTMAVALFANDDKLDSIPNGGILYAWDGDSFIQFGIQAIGVAVIAAWAFFWTFLLFGGLRIAGLLRVSGDQENDGLDFIDGEPAYPMDPAILAAYADDFSNTASSTGT